MDESPMPDSMEVVIPADILDLVTIHGANGLPSRGKDGVNRSVLTVRLRAYWGRLTELAVGRAQEADRWLYAYVWAVREERRIGKL